MSIDDEPVNVVTTIGSAGWLVGGEMRLLTEKERVVPAAKAVVATLLAVTTAKEEEPLH